MTNRYNTYKLFPDFIDVAGVIIDIHLFYGSQNILDLWKKFDDLRLLVKKGERGSKYSIRASQEKFVRIEWERLIEDGFLKERKRGGTTKTVYNEKIVIESVPYLVYLSQQNQTSKSSP